MKTGRTVVGVDTAKTVVRTGYAGFGLVFAALFFAPALSEAWLAALLLCAFALLGVSAVLLVFVTADAVRRLSAAERMWEKH